MVVKQGIKRILGLWFFGLAFTTVLAQRPTHIQVDTLTNLIDGNSAPFDQVLPGDTLIFEPGNHDFLLIRNLHGDADHPVVFINGRGRVVIDTDHYFGISIRDCSFFRLTGTGDASGFYGFQINRVKNGGGLGIGNGSSDFEIDHLSIENCHGVGISAKTDPDCSLNYTRDRFTQANTLIHDNYIANVDNEGMYIGSSKYFGQHVSCDGQDTLLLPSLLDGVQIYNNIVRQTGWDGIQVSSASSRCNIYNNLVLSDSQSGFYNQMSGILIGGGSKCDCYNNYIGGGKGNGIENHGLGGYRIFNNIIVDAGQGYLPLDSMEMRHGIFVSDVSTQADSSYAILFNTIISPKSDGIRFSSSVSRNNLIASNLIVNPGNYDFYENGNTSFDGMDAYVMLTSSTSDVILRNNYFCRTAEPAGISADDFTLLPGSPLIDAAYADLRGIDFDYFYHIRPSGISADIGAFEYDPAFLGFETGSSAATNPVRLYPDPVRDLLTIHFTCSETQPVTLSLFNLKGERVYTARAAVLSKAENEIRVDVSAYPAGIYLYQLRSGNFLSNGKIIKIN